MDKSYKSLLFLFLLVPVLCAGLFLIFNRGEVLKPDSIIAKTFFASDSTYAAKFVPHKALYDIKIAGVKSGSQILNISGQMYYEWKPSCEGWLSDHRFNMLYEYADTPPTRIISNFSSFESFDGKTLDFTSQKKSNGEIFEEIRGTANENEATFTQPSSDLSHELPEGTIFPVAHTIAVARQVASGQKFFKATLFDGSDVDGPSEVTSFIGDRVSAPPSLMGQDGIDSELLKVQARKVRLAFFPMKSEEFTADYEMDILFHDNGVISDMFIEYADFSVSQKLVALEKTNAGCSSLKEFNTSQN